MGTMIGWVIDSAYRSLVDRKWTNAGYFIGPFCPIYGFGGITLLFLVSGFEGYPFFARCGIYFLAMTLVELIGGFFSTHVLKVRLWDYSDAPFNLFGQVDILHSFYWVVLAVLFEGLVWPVFTFINEFSDIVVWVDYTIFSTFLIAFSFALGRKMIKERRRVKPFIREGTPESMWKYLDRLNDQYVNLLGRVDEVLLIPAENRSRDFLEEREYILEQTHENVDTIRRDLARLRGRIPTSRLENELAFFNRELKERSERIRELKVIKDSKKRHIEIENFVRRSNRSNLEFLKRVENSSSLVSWMTYVKKRGRSFHPFSFLDRFPEWHGGWKKRKEDLFTLLRSDNG